MILAVASSWSVPHDEMFDAPEKTTTELGSSTVTWTVQRRATPPPASVVILPKIKATDMEGRPQPFKQAADVARSKGPFTRKVNVELRIPTPPDVGSDLVYVSNYEDFRDVRVFPIAADELYDWNLLEGPSGDRPVWMRFSDDPDAAVGRATIVLDQELPVLKPTFVGISVLMYANSLPSGE